MNLCVKAYNTCVVEIPSSEKRQIRIGVLNDTIPNIIHIDQIHTSKPGIAYNITQLLCNALKANCTFTFLPHGNYYTFNNKTWGGFLAQILNDTYDTSLPVFYKSQFRDLYFSTSKAVLIDPYYFVTRRPESTHQISAVTALLKPFQWKLWITLLSMAIFMSLLIRFFQTEKRETPSKMITTLINVMSILVKKCQNFTGITPAGKAIVTIWSLSAVFITAYYSSGLLTSLIRIHPNPPFTDFHSMLDCLYSGICRMILIPDDFWFLQTINDSTSQLHPLAGILNKYPALKASNLNESYTTILNTKDVYLVSGQRSATDVTPLTKQKDCGHLLLEFPSDYYFLFRKRDPIVEQINRKIDSLKFTGIIDRIMSIYPKIEKCRVQDFLSQQQKRSALPIPLNWIFGAVFATGIGFSLGLLMLGFEIFLARLGQ